MASTFMVEFVFDGVDDPNGETADSIAEALSAECKVWVEDFAAKSVCVVDAFGEESEDATD